MKDGKRSIVDIVVVIALLLAGLVGLFMSLCGGLFVVTSLAHARDAAVVLILAVGFLVFGLMIVFAVREAWVARRRKRQSHE